MRTEGLQLQLIQVCEIVRTVEIAAYVYVCCHLLRISAKRAGKPSWTAKLLSDEQLLCSKIREEASELCQTLENNEGKERAAQEMADVLYHSMVLLKKQDVEMEAVLRILRGRFGLSGVDEKKSRNS